MLESMDEITLPPTMVGSHGRAWRLPPDAMGWARETRPVWPGFVCGWIVEAAWAHPIWHSYFVSLAHLRPDQEAPPPKVFLPGATHELVLLALDQTQDRQTMIDQATMATLYPLNFGAQFIAESDGAAIDRVEAAVRDVCAGRLSPDTDFQRDWVARFGDNMLRR